MALVGVVDSWEPGDDTNPAALEKLLPTGTRLTLVEGEPRAIELTLTP